MTDLAGACADLAALLPALPAALSRDNAPAEGHTALTAGSLVNADVLHAIEITGREIPAARASACEMTGEPCPARPLGACLLALPRLRDRLADLGMAGEALDVDDAVSRWTRLVKLALGLASTGRPLARIFGRAMDCPLHPEPSPLWLAGSEGFLTSRNGVAWLTPGKISCPACGAAWDASQWPLLGKLLEAA